MNFSALTFLMHEVYAIINSSKVKLNDLANNNDVRVNDLLINEVLEVQSYVEQINLLLNYADIKQNPDSIDNILESDPIDLNLLKTFQKPNQYFKNLIKRKRLKYKVQADSNIPTVKGYAILHSIGNILLDNAIKYSPNDSDIECHLECMNNELIITMNNEGPFIDAEELLEIRNIGVRGKNAVLTGRRGHGFGLDFLSEIIEKIHCGKFEISSTFNFHLDSIKYGTFTCRIVLPIS